jgi:hypothetical protein
MRLTYVEGNRSRRPWIRTEWPQRGQRSGSSTLDAELPNARKNAHFSHTA